MVSYEWYEFMQNVVQFWFYIKNLFLRSPRSFYSCSQLPSMDWIKYWISSERFVSCDTRIWWKSRKFRCWRIEPDKNYSISSNYWIISQYFKLEIRTFNSKLKFRSKKIKNARKMSKNEIFTVIFGLGSPVLQNFYSS